MARFKPGQQVVCIKECAWESEGKVEPFGPKYGEIVTVKQYIDDVYIFISKYVIYPSDGMRAAYLESNFQPLMDITELTEILEQQPEHA